MVQVPIRQLNQDTAGVMARVQRGEVVEVTNRGRTIARIVPAGVDTLADLVAAGLVVPPTTSGPLPMPEHVAASGEDGGRLLSELRDEERW